MDKWHEATGRKYMLRVHTDGEYASLSYAFIEFTDDLLDFIRQVWLIAIPALKGFSEQFLRAEYLDYHPVFVNVLPPEFDEVSESDEFNDAGLVRLADDAAFPQCDRLEVATIQIEDDGFRWTVRAKHALEESYTDTVYYKEIFSDA
jgi:hypothetical protein